MDPIKEKILARIDSLREEIVSTSRHLHAHPELSNEEHESSRLLASRAESNGFNVEMGIAGLPTSFHARVTRKKQIESQEASSKTARIAFLAEYDALPVVGHGCGHNLIGTAGTYAAIGLAAAADDLPGEINLYGTPAEETFGGKITMLEAGAFEGLTAAIMMHPGVETEIAYSSLACIPAVIEFHGRSAHAAASPWKGINALDAMIQLFVSIDLMKKQLPVTARCPGVITHGGERANMVPDYTRAQFSVRGKDREEAELVHQKLLACAQGAAAATGARMKSSLEGHPYWDMRPDDKLAGLFRNNWLAVGGDEPLSTPRPHGSLDIGNLSHLFPCLHPSFKITHDQNVGGHTHEFAAATVTEFAEEQLIKAIKAMALTGADVLREN